MKHLGDFDTSTIVYGKFTTFQPSTGAPFTLAGTPALSVYKDNSTTQSTTGVTLTVDFDSVTGFHHYAIDTSADGAFYAAGSFFDIVITTGTVDSVSVVGVVVGSFTIRKNSALKPTTAGRTLDVSAGGEAGLDWANIGSPTTTVNFSGTTIKTATDVETDTADIQSRLPAALVSGRMDSYVGAMANNVITSSVVATNAFSNSAFTTGYFNSINAEVDTALADYDAPTKAELDAAETAIIAAIPDITPLEADVTAVKAKTDNLTFTVAGQVDANTESINGATVNGNGTSGNLWRGA